MSITPSNIFNLVRLYDPRPACFILTGSTFSFAGVKTQPSAVRLQTLLVPL